MFKTSCGRITRKALAAAHWALPRCPALHVASSALIALLGWRVNRALGVAGTIFALLILIGSVHLGRHYALDGYVGAAGACLIWRVTGFITSASRHSVHIPVPTPLQEAVRLAICAGWPPPPF
ncbi:phosphatase PAP2 family protein [Pseudoduganella sp. UC29_106]|uniref:phosphatase PAP2 family protein n=1 Tax=Pseudoduganella sp. UC29_106 TaxID=3374553 RepID=UPI003756C199